MTTLRIEHESIELPPDGTGYYRFTMGPACYYLGDKEITEQRYHELLQAMGGTTQREEIVVPNSTAGTAAGMPASPFDHSHTPDEPARGAVLAYQHEGHNGAVLDYVSMRAGDGRWYTTGRNSDQGVMFVDLWAALRRAGVRTVYVATGWSPMAVPPSRRTPEQIARDWNRGATHQVHGDPSAAGGARVELADHPYGLPS